MNTIKSIYHSVVWSETGILAYICKCGFTSGPPFEEMTWKECIPGTILTVILHGGMLIIFVVGGMAILRTAERNF